MKRCSKIFKITVLFLVFILSLTTLTSCGEGITKAKETIESFCEALENGDSAGAVALMHPTAEMTEEELIKSIREVEEEFDISFTDGVTVVIFKDPSVNYSLNFPEGLIGLISINLDIIVSGKFFTVSVEVLEYDDAVGIINFIF